jgi:flagellar hook-associated protein 3 FlgL
MRVTQNSNFDTLRDSMNLSKGRMEKLQTQASTLKKLNTPSDDPVGSSKILEVRTDKVNNEQFIMNAKLAEANLNNTDHAIAEIADLVTRAKEIAIGQASGASSNDDTRLGIAEEVGQLFQQAVVAANRRIGDRYIFGGFKTDRPPVDPDGRYQGDDGQMMVEIGRDVFLSANLPGYQVFNTHPQSSSDQRSIELGPQRKLASEGGDGVPQTEQNINVFNELQGLRISLLTGDLEGIRAKLDTLDQLHAHLLANRAKVGSRVRGLASTQEALDRHNITHAQLTTHLEDADMSQVMNDLAKEETVFRTVMQSGKRLIQPTLMDFLK